MAAVEPVAVETAWGPEVGTQGEGWGELWAAWPPFQHPLSGFAGTGGSVCGEKDQLVFRPSFHLVLSADSTSTEKNYVQVITHTAQTVRG